MLPAVPGLARRRRLPQVGQTWAAGADVGSGVLVRTITGVNEGGVVGVAEDARVSDGCRVSVGAVVGVASAGAAAVSGGAVVAVKMANGVRVALGISVGRGSLVGSAASVGGAVRVGAAVGVEKTNAVAVGRAGAGTSVCAVAQAMGVPSVGRGTVVGSLPSVLKVHPASATHRVREGTPAPPAPC